jgi:hypothetical protein
MRASVIEDHLTSPVPLNRHRLRRLGTQLPEGARIAPGRPLDAFAVAGWGALAWLRRGGAIRNSPASPTKPLADVTLSCSVLKGKTTPGVLRIEKPDSIVQVDSARNSGSPERALHNSFVNISLREPFFCCRFRSQTYSPNA